MSNEVKKFKSAYVAKIERFKRIIYGSKTVNIDALRDVSTRGIPEGHGIRGITWKILLNLVPLERSEWKRVLTKKREEYKCFCEDLIVDPKTADLSPLQRNSDVDPDVDSLRGFNRNVSGLSDVVLEDHPLSVDSSSRWNIYFKDSEIRDQINKDIMRTHPDMHFFSGDSEASELHRMEMKRALFVFAKVNPGLSYVQGMNEIYAPLYYVFKTSEHGEFGEQDGFGSADHAEADAFFCFVDLMGEFRDNYTKQLDHSTSGVRVTIEKFSDLLHSIDPHLWRHLKYKTEVDHHFFAFRWITLLLTQEFSFPDVLRLWDSLTAARTMQKEKLLHRVCIAMLLKVREDLLGGDYSQNLKLLQQYPSHDVNELIDLALDLISPPA